METGGKTNFTPQHDGFTVVFPLYLSVKAVMSLELWRKMENRLTFTDQHLSEACCCNSRCAEMLRCDGGNLHNDGKS